MKLEVSKYKQTLIAGDLNANIGKDKLKEFCFLDKTDRNEGLSLDLLNECYVSGLEVK